MLDGRRSHHLGKQIIPRSRLGLKCPDDSIDTEAYESDDIAALEDITLLVQLPTTNATALPCLAVDGIGSSDLSLCSMCTIKP